MVATDEDALICDLWETYQITNWRALPLQTVAVLAIGLSEDARIKRGDRRCTMEELLLGMILDRLTSLCYSMTKDAKYGRNKPEPVVPILMGEKKKTENKRGKSFASTEDFEAEWARITGEKHHV